MTVSYVIPDNGKLPYEALIQAQQIYTYSLTNALIHQIAQIATRLR